MFCNLIIYLYFINIPIVVFVDMLYTNNQLLIFLLNFIGIKINVYGMNYESYILCMPTTIEI